MSTSLKPTTAPGDLLPGRWFDGRSSKARPVLVGLQPTPQGPSLVLHPLSPPGAAPVVFTSRQVDWPEAWNERRPPPCVVLDLRDLGSVEIDAVAPWRAALAAGARRLKDIKRLLSEPAGAAQMTFAERHPLIRDLHIYGDFITHHAQNTQNPSPQTASLRTH